MDMEEQLSGKDLHAIYSDVFDAAKKWYNLGLALGLLPDELDKIRSAHRDEPDVCLREMLKICLSKSTPKPTRKALICALHQRTVDYQQLAHELEMKYKNINQTREQVRSGVESKTSASYAADKTIDVNHDQKTSEHSFISSTGSDSSVKDLTASTEVSYLKETLNIIS